MPRISHDPAVARLLTLWASYGYAALICGMAALALFVLGSLLVAWHKGNLGRWVWQLSWVTVFGFTAEGMWIVVTRDAHLPKPLALILFVVGDALLVSNMIQARAAWQRTTVRDGDGRIVRAGDPGKHGRAVWLIAAVEGGLTAFASRNLVEALLRLFLPLGAAMLYWNDLTAEGVVRSDTDRTTWAWTPRRALLWVGAIEPGERDVRRANRDRQIRRLLPLALCTHGVIQVPEDRQEAARLKLARRLAGADPEVVTELQARVERATRAVQLTAPDARDRDVELVELRARTADLAAAVELARQEAAEAARRADASVEAAEAAARHAEQQAGQERQAREAAERRAAEISATAAAERQAREAAERRAADAAGRALAERQAREAADAAARQAGERQAAAFQQAAAADEARRVAERQAADAVRLVAESAGRQPAERQAAGGRGGNRQAAGGKAWAATIARYQQIERAQPGRTQQQYAVLLGIPERTLRQHRSDYEAARQQDQVAADAEVTRAANALGNGNGVPALAAG